MHVCHIISGDLWAGAEVMTFNLLESLKYYNNIKLSVILLNEGRLADEIRGMGIKTDVLNEASLTFYNIVKSVRNSHIYNEPIIYHTHRYKENAIAYISKLNRNSVHLINTQHGMPELESNNYDIYNKIKHILNNHLLSLKYNNIVAVSNDIREILIYKCNIPGNKITVIPNGVPLPISIIHNNDKKYFTIGSMGRLFPVKNYSCMVKIAHEIAKVTNNIYFELAGDGPEKANIIELIKKYNLENIFQLKGHIDNVDIFYRGIDLYLNTSIHEGMPMSVLEAMSYGIPIVAPNIGGFKEIIENGKQGYLLEEMDPKLFALKCLEVLHSDKLRKSMGIFARENVERNYSTKRMANNYYNLYMNMIS